MITQKQYCEIQLEKAKKNRDNTTELRVYQLNEKEVVHYTGLLNKLKAVSDE